MNVAPESAILDAIGGPACESVIHLIEYSGLKLNTVRATGAHPLAVQIDPANTGQRDGAEVVQVFVQPPRDADPAEPEQQLKAFQKVNLKRGEQKKVVRELDRRAFAHYDAAFLRD